MGLSGDRLAREVWQYCIAGLRPGDLEGIYPSLTGQPVDGPDTSQ
jgi:hypothetical protein